MALPRKTIKPNPGQITPISAVPHVSPDALGGYRHPKSDTLGPSEPQDKVKKIGPTPENSGSTELTCQNQPAETSTDSAIGQSQGPENQGSDEVSKSNLKVRTDLGPKNQGVGPILLSDVNDIFHEASSHFSRQVLEAAENGTLGALVDQVNAALTQVVQLRWGCQRVTTRTKLGNWRGAPEQVDTRIVGQVQAGDRQSETDADMFAADVAFMDFLIDVRESLAAAGLPWADVQDRLDFRIASTDIGFRAMAIELGELRSRFDKADAIQEAGGWAPDKVEAADAVLRKVTLRMDAVRVLMERFRPDLLPAVWPEARAEVAA